MALQDAMARREVDQQNPQPPLPVAHRGSRAHSVQTQCGRMQKPLPHGRQEHGSIRTTTFSSDHGYWRTLANHYHAMGGVATRRESLLSSSCKGYRATDTVPTICDQYVLWTTLCCNVHTGCVFSSVQTKYPDWNHSRRARKPLQRIIRQTKQWHNR